MWNIDNHLVVRSRLIRSTTGLSASRPWQTNSGKHASKRSQAYMAASFTSCLGSFGLEPSLIGQSTRSQATHPGTNAASVKDFDQSRPERLLQNPAKVHSVELLVLFRPARQDAGKLPPGSLRYTEALFTLDRPVPAVTQEVNGDLARTRLLQKREEV